VGTAHQPHTSFGDGEQWPPCGTVAGFLLLMAFAVFRMPPWLPLFVHETNGVDPSWQILLNEAVPNDWVFGRDLFFTYGPFGFIHARMYHPETWIVLVVVWIGVSIVLADLVWRVAGHGRLNPTWRTLLGVGILEVLSRDAMATCFGLHALIFLDALHVPIDEQGDADQKATRSIGMTFVSSIRMSLPVLFLAALPWAKFSYFVTVLFLGCSLAVVALLQRRFPWRATLLLAACPLAWLISGATPAACGEFIGTGFQLAGGYSAAMGLGPVSTAGMAVIVTSACVVLLLPIWFSSRSVHHDRRLRLLTMLFLYGLLFIVWKSCFVRYHAERIPVFLGTVFPLLAYGMFCSGVGEAADLPVGRFFALLHSLNRRLVMPGLFAVLSVMLLVGTAERVQRLTPGETVRLAVAPLRNQVLSVVQSVKEPDWRQSTHQSELEDIRRANPVPDVVGTVDVFPGKLAVAFAHGLKLQPRPLLQSYAAFTSRLIERDAEHFRGPDAPDHVLMSIGEIDGRLPTMEDSQAWFELLSRYDLVDSSGELLKLSLRSQPCFVSRFESKLRMNVKFGEQINLPPAISGPVWCRIHIEPSLAGRAASVLYRLPEVRLRLRSIADEGADRDFRMLAGAGSSGFLISPVVETREDIIRLWQWRDCDDAEHASNEGGVVSMTCFVVNENWGEVLFDTEITVEFFECLKQVDPLPESARPTDVATRARSSF
jgi:hypothetical protein